MKVIITRNIFDGAVHGADEATIKATVEEVEAFVQALKVIEKFKFKAREALKINEQHADWTTYKYDIKKSEGIVNVRIDTGACG
jgi:hypothetical protein